MTDVPTSRPAETPHGRIAPMAVLPVFFKLNGKRVVLAGGDDGAAWKAELLAACGAQVDVYAAEPSEEMRHLPGQTADGSVVLHERGWMPADMAGAAFAVGGVESDDEAVAFRDAAHAAGVPVNVIDRPAFCDLQFGSIVNRSPLVIGISTDGAAPVFGQAVRARIETLIPQTFKRWAEAARAWRPAVQALDLPFRARRAFWERFTAAALAAPGSVPGHDLQARLLRDTEAAPEARGSVALVGAGPGDPELMTLKAVRYLQSADVILHDDLIHPGVIDLARREARLIHVGKRGYKPSCTQSDINGLLVELAGQGLKVVRLKGGDPMIFGRAGEEIAACEAAGIPVEVIPGVTSASGAAAALNTSLTHRDVARRLQFITCHARDGKLPTDFDWAALADPRATTAVYMGVRTLREFADKVIHYGLDPATPAAVVEKATREDQRVIEATIGELPDRVAEAAPKGPCLILIGDALRAARPGAHPAHAATPAEDLIVGT